MRKGYLYILKCSDGSYYTGSTKYLKRRIMQHESGLGARHTRKRLPVKLVYVEEYGNVAQAFKREKQIQGWNRKKKEALINFNYDQLPGLSKSRGLPLGAVDGLRHRAIPGVEKITGP